MERYTIDVKARKDGQYQIPFKAEWEHLRPRIGYAMTSAKVTPGIELVSRESFERFQNLIDELPKNAKLVGQLFTKSMPVWDATGEELVLSLELMEYAGIENRAVLLAGEEFIALCSPETASKY